MSYRCIGAFAFADNIFGDGELIADDNPILKSHAHLFVKVDEPVTGSRTEVASSAPGEFRSPFHAKKVGRPAKRTAPPAADSVSVDSEKEN